MRLIHLACVAPPQTGGLGEVPLLEVASLNGRGFFAELLAPAVNGFQDALPVRRLKTIWSYGNAARLSPSAVIAAVQGADVVHLHYPFYGTAGLIASLRRRGVIRRLVVTLHMDATAGGLLGFIFNFHRKFLQRRVLQAADALIVSSLDYARHSSFAPYASGSTQISEIPFGVDEQRFSPGAQERLMFGIPQDKQVVLFVGGMDRAHAFKGVDVLLRALARLPASVFGVLVGDGALRPSYETMASNLGIGDRVKFLGRVPYADLPKVYRSADVLAMPSISSAEAFGLVALEAQSCGVPVVATELPGVRTVVDNGVTGLLVPPQDDVALAEKLEEILGNEFKRTEMGKAAIEHVHRRFTREKHMDELIALYRRVCASPS